MYTLIPSPASVPIPARPLQEQSVGLEGTKWSLSDQKKFEKLLAEFEDDMPDRWEKMASELGRAVSELVENYEALLLDIILIESEIERSFGDSFEHKRQRKKAVPWTADEHKSFLVGIGKYGQGDWRSVSRKAVKTRTPMQVASHAQKYNERLKLNAELKLDETKKRRRKSIHDFTIKELEQVTPEKKELEEVAPEKKEHLDTAKIK